MTRSRPLRLLAGLSGLLVPAGLEAQTGLYADAATPAVQIEVAKAFFEGDAFGFASSVLDATVLVPMRAGSTLFARWGVSYATADALPSSTTTSNLRLGMIFGEPGVTSGELHVDLPIASEYGDDDYATGFAIFTDYERFERFLADAWSVGGSVAPQRELPSGAIVGGRLGATLLMPTEDGPDSELFVLPGAFATLPAGSARIGAELSASVIMSEEGLSFAQRSIFLGTLSVALPNASAAPELYLRLPLDDDLGEVIDFVLGVRVRFGG